MNVKIRVIVNYKGRYIFIFIFIFFFLRLIGAVSGRWRRFPLGSFGAVSEQVLKMLQARSGGIFSSSFSAVGYFGAVSDLACSTGRSQGDMRAVLGQSSVVIFTTRFRAVMEPRHSRPVQFQCCVSAVSVRFQSSQHQTKIHRLHQFQLFNWFIKKSRFDLINSQSSE